MHPKKAPKKKLHSKKGNPTKTKKVCAQKKDTRSEIMKKARELTEGGMSQSEGLKEAWKLAREEKL